jgi:NADPH2:quinone reductase
MRAIVVEAGPKARLLWKEVADPSYGSEEVVVRVRASAVNRADLLQRRGKYPPPPGASEYLGLEASGEIESAGSAARPWKVGDAVCCLLAGGGYAEKIAVHRDLLLPVPAGMSFEEAASLPEVFATAHLNLFMDAGLSRGETVLVHAGASGVGIAAIQLAHRQGARVVTTVGTAAKIMPVRELGADDVLLRTAEDFPETLRELSEDPGFDVVLDCLGGEDLGEHFSRMNVGGRWVVIALLGGDSTRLDLRRLLTRRLRLIGSTLRSRTIEEKGKILADLRAKVWPLLEDGRVRPVVHAVFPVEQAEEAHAVLERRENVGKVVLEVSG